MKNITVLEISDYEKVTPKMLVMYLEKLGWEKIWGTSDFVFWQLDGERNGVSVPTHQFYNFANKICCAIKGISEIYHKDEVDVFNEILELGKEEIVRLICVKRREFIKWLVDAPMFDKFEVTLQEETVKFQCTDSNKMYLTNYFDAIEFADKSIYDQPF